MGHLCCLSPFYFFFQPSGPIRQVKFSFMFAHQSCVYLTMKTLNRCYLPCLTCFAFIVKMHCLVPSPFQMEVPYFSDIISLHAYRSSMAWFIPFPVEGPSCWALTMLPFFWQIDLGTYILNHSFYHLSIASRYCQA